MNKKLYIGDGESALKDLEGTQIGLNIENSIGEGSLAQVNKGVTDSEGIPLTEKKEGDPTYYDAKAKGASAMALGARTEANGDTSLAAGYNAKAYTKGDIALNGSSQAGLTAAEFTATYPDGYRDYTGIIYETYEDFCKKVVSGSFACNNGRAKGISSFSAGLQGSGKGSLADRSATFGQNCTAKIGANNSLVGGTVSDVYSYSSIVYGDQLRDSRRTYLNDNGKEESISVAIFGKYNKNFHDNENEPDYATIMEVGNGTGEDAKRSNAFSVLWDGRAKVSGKPQYDNDVARLEEIKEVRTELVQTETELKDDINPLKSYAAQLKENIKINADTSKKFFAVNSGIATGINSFSTGLHAGTNGSLADRSATFGEECRTVAGKATNSFAGGVSVIVHNANSIAYGNQLSATGRTFNGKQVTSATFGQYNQYYHTYSSPTIFEIGNGTSDSARSNAFEVLFDGRAKAHAKATEAHDVLTWENKQEITAEIDTKIASLQVEAITGTRKQTITSISQTNGTISASYSDIDFPVTKVAGKTGIVTLTKGDVGLGNVDNTSDASKKVAFKTAFTGSIKSGDAGFVTGGDIYTKLQTKANTTSGNGTVLYGYIIEDTLYLV